VNKYTGYVVIIAVCAVLTACNGGPSKQQVGTAGGAVGGGLIGSAVGGGTAGTIAGSTVGAVVGSEVGKKWDDDE